MAEEKANPDVETEEQDKGQRDKTEQTVTREQFAELQRQLEETRKAQSGSDRTVAELRKALEQKEQEAANAEKTAQQKAEERIAEIEKKLQAAEAEKERATQRGVAQQLLSDEGIKAPKFLDRLIGKDGEETEAMVKEYIETVKQTKLSAADEFAKKNGRKITETDKSGGPGTFDDYTPEQVKAMTTEQYEAVWQRTYGNK